MKLLCINNKTIKTDIHGYGKYNNTGNILKEGEVYETLGKAFINPQTGNECYYIQGIGSKLKCRFVELLEDSFIAKKQLEEINKN